MRLGGTVNAILTNGTQTNHYYLFISQQKKDQWFQSGLLIENCILELSVTGQKDIITRRQNPGIHSENRENYLRSGLSRFE